MKGLVPIRVKINLNQEQEQRIIIPFSVDGQFPTFISRIADGMLFFYNNDFNDDLNVSLFVSLILKEIYIFEM